MPMGTAGARCSPERSRLALSRGMARGARCAEGAGQAAPSRRVHDRPGGLRRRREDQAARLERGGSAGAAQSGELALG
eukprot:5944773-Alexandrium_andersonii.AAC.1